MIRAAIRSARHRVLAVLDEHTRARLGRVFLIAVALWTINSLLLFVFEPPSTNSEFQHIGDYFWGVVVYLFSGLESYVPITIPGKLVAGLTLVSAAVFIAVFTAEAVGVIVELTRRQGLVPRKSRAVKFAGHVVVCGWSALGPAVVKQLRSDAVTTERPVVIVDPSATDITAKSVLPRRRRALGDVWALSGDPSRPDVLALADIGSAAAAIILADHEDEPEADGIDRADGISLRVALALAAANPKLPVFAEIRRESSRAMLELAAVSALVSAEEISARIMAQAVMQPGLTGVVGELLAVTSRTCEPYFIRAPSGAIGVRFAELCRQCVAAGVSPVALQPDSERLQVNPGTETVVGAGDVIVCLGATERAARSALEKVRISPVASSAGE